MHTTDADGIIKRDHAGGGRDQLMMNAGSTRRAVIIATLTEYWYSRGQIALFVLVGYVIKFIRNVRLSWRLLQDGRVPFVVKLLPLAALAYLIFPLDLLRDFIPMIGLVDDLIALALAFALLTRLAPRRVVDEHRQSFSGGARDGPQIITDAKYRVHDDDEK